MSRRSRPHYHSGLEWILGVAFEDTLTRPARLAQGFTHVRCCGSPRASSPHGLAAPALASHDGRDCVQLPPARGCYHLAPRRTFTSNPVPMPGTPSTPPQRHSHPDCRAILTLIVALSATMRPETTAPGITITLDSTFIRSCQDGERHLEVRVGNVETASGGRQVFGAVAGSDTDIKMLIRRNLEAVGQTEDTALTAFTDGCAGLRRILADADLAEPPMLDWFHIGMRLQHLKQIASALSTDDPARMAAKAVIVAETERLHWRIWNGKAKNAQKSIDRIRTVMHQFQGEPRSKKSVAPSRKLWTALQALDGYLSGQSHWLINYAERQRAGLRVGTAITEGTANFLVNRRMNKSQQMRWSLRGADLLLQVRCAVYNGTFGSAYGQKFQPANDSSAPVPNAA